MITSNVARGLFLAAGMLAATVTSPRAQESSTSKGLSFEVASVKRNRTGSVVGGLSLSGERYSATNISVLDMLASIYQPLPRSRLVGGPRWIGSDRFDIAAKAEGPATPPEMFAMLKALLVERFKLAAHAEVRAGDVYDLVLARDDGRLGPALRPSRVECAARGDGQPCSFSNYPGRISGKAGSLATLANALTVWADRRDVRDRTGLTGFYDVDLVWTPERLGPAPLNAPDEVLRAREAIDPNGPSLFAAIREQLGLKLEARTDNVDVIVIDRLEPPAED